MINEGLCKKSNSLLFVIFGVRKKLINNFCSIFPIELKINFRLNVLITLARGLKERGGREGGR